MLPEVLTASSQNDPVSRKALLLHQKRDVTVFLVGHQRRQLLRQKVHVVDLSRRGERAQRVTVAHGCHLHLYKTWRLSRCEIDCYPIIVFFFLLCPKDFSLTGWFCKSAFNQDSFHKCGIKKKHRYLLMQCLPCKSQCLSGAIETMRDCSRCIQKLSRFKRVWFTHTLV